MQIALHMERKGRLPRDRMFPADCLHAGPQQLRLQGSPKIVEMDSFYLSAPSQSVLSPEQL